MKTSKTALPLICLALFSGISFAQVPGDGIPDVYFVVPGCETFPTSIGAVTRPAGTMLVDTDGTDMVALIIEGPDVATTLTDNQDYLFGLTSNLPDPNNPPLNFSSWNVGFTANGSQWLRGSPDDTLGFTGVSGVHDEDPFDLFPNVGLTTYSGGPSDFGNITYSTDGGTVFSTEDGTMSGVSFCVPEPGTMSLFGLALLSLLGLRRRR